MASVAAAQGGWQDVPAGHLLARRGIWSDRGVHQASLTPVSKVKVSLLSLGRPVTLAFDL